LRNGCFSDGFTQDWDDNFYSHQLFSFC